MSVLDKVNPLCCYSRKCGTAEGGSKVLYLISVPCEGNLLPVRILSVPNLDLFSDPMALLCFSLAQHTVSQDEIYSRTEGQ
jgi:hypothetical protein